jgi:RNA-directed DNA polymerase
VSDRIKSYALPRADIDRRLDKYPALGVNLMAQITSRDSLNTAWQRVRANKGAGGIDGVSIDNFNEWFKPRSQAVLEQLGNGTYQPQPVMRVVISKPDGGDRLLGIPTILDRIIQQSIVMSLEPYIDPSFSDSSYGFRPHRSAHDAIRKIRAGISTGRKVAVDIDLSKFFDRVNHDVLMRLLAQRIDDKAVLRLIGRYLRSGVSIDGKLIASTEGVPQGGPLSPLLSNIVLDVLDKELESRGHHFARYADDFMILVKSMRAGERVMGSVSTFLSSRLKLKVNTEKSRVVKINKSIFLGFTFRGKFLQIHPKSLLRLKQRVRQLTSRSWGISLSAKIAKLSRFLRGWINYYGIANCYQLCVDLDHWIRRRIRMCYWKQWRRVRTKVGKLISLGVPLNLAVTTGSSRKGYWHSAKSPGINLGLSNGWLVNQGLVSLRSRWITLHYG